MTKTLKRLLMAVLALTLVLSTLAACNNSVENETESSTEAESGDGESITDFDYANANISEYIALSASEYLNSSVTLSTDYIITDDAVKEHIDGERFKHKTKTNGDTQVTDQPIKLGDSAFIYYTGFLDGKEFEGGSNASDTKPYELSIGSGSFIPGFEEGLIGVIPAETSKDAPFDLHVTFPKNYGNADLAGKAVIFKVWIEYVVQYTIPELTDDFVKSTVKFDGTVEQYKANVKETLQSEAISAANEEALAAIMSNLMEKATISKYPEQSVTFWYNNYLSEIQYYVDMYAMYGMEVTLDEMACQMLGLSAGSDWQTPLNDMAKDTVKSILIYYAIAHQQSISVSDDEFVAEAKEIAEYYSNENKTYTADEVIAQIGEATIRQNLLTEKVDKFLLEHCKIEFKDE